MACDRDVPFDRCWTRRLSDRTVREAIRHPRRRYALYYLRERPAPVPVEEVAEQVAAWERSDRGRHEQNREATTPKGESVASSLRRHHVPYLAERGIVTYDRRRDLAVYDTDDSLLALCLTNDPRTSVPWHRVYLALTAISAVILALVWQEVGPFAGLPAIAVATIVVILFAVTSAVHWYDVHRWRRANAGDPPNFLLTYGSNLTERVRSREDRDDECDGD